MLETLGIARADKESRQHHYVEMVRLFGAPCLIVLTLPREVELGYGMLDIGIVTHAICLAAHAEGVGSCIMAASVGYPDLLREVGAVSKDRLIVIGIALGYAEEHPVNRFPRSRAELSALVTWAGERSVAFQTVFL